MAKLKPCPFCGKTPKVVSDVRFPPPNQFRTEAFEVVCMNPKCPIYRADNTYFLSKEEAIKAWNKRVVND